MKLALTTLTAVTALILASPRLAAETRDLSGARTRPVPVTFDEVVLPDSPHPNDEAIITVGGVFRSSCERSLHAQVESPDGHTHYVKAVAMRLIDYACAQVEREYVQDISLGRLDTGTHQLMVEADDGGFAVRQFTVE